MKYLTHYRRRAHELGRRAYLEMTWRKPCSPPATWSTADWMLPRMAPMGLMLMRSMPGRPMLFLCMERITFVVFHPVGGCCPQWL